MSLSLLIIEDDYDLAFELGDYLGRAGFSVRHAATLAAAEEMLNSVPDLILLDINLPDGSGLDFCRRLSGNPHTGVVMCTARAERDLRIASLKEGADAYLVKPVDPEELEATLRCVYRRLHAMPTSQLLLQAKAHPWRLDVTQALLMAPNGVSMLLQSNEVRLLEFVFSQTDRTASREQLLSALDDGGEGAAHRLETLISRLRRKVSDKANLKLPLISHYGKGYGFNAPIVCSR